MKKILAIYGSHRRGQNSDIALDALLEGIKGDVTVKRLFLAKLNISPCRSCNSCFKDAKCIIQDVMQSLYEDFDEADMVITSTPIYFDNISSHLKIMIDRCQCLWAGKYVLKKSPISQKPRLGHILCVSGSDMGDKYFDCALRSVNAFYSCIYTKTLGKTLISDTDGVHVKDRQETLDGLNVLGQKYAQMLMG